MSGGGKNYLAAERMGGSVHALRGNPQALKADAQRLLDQMEHAPNISANLNQRYLIKGWLDQGGVSVLYGEANTGKSFLALDMAHSIAKARWRRSVSPPCRL